MNEPGHFPSGSAKVVVAPDPEHPSDPVVVVIDCTCGDPECFWSATAYDPVRNPPRPSA